MLPRAPASQPRPACLLPCAAWALVALARVLGLFTYRPQLSLRVSMRSPKLLLKTTFSTLAGSQRQEEAISSLDFMLWWHFYQQPSISGIWVAWLKFLGM